jgi:hypothetical protein
MRPVVVFKGEAIKHAGKRISNRHMAFHFCEWALQQRKVTIAAVQKYLDENKMPSGHFRALQLKNDWLEYRSILMAHKAKAARCLLVDHDQPQMNTAPKPLYPPSRSLRRA